MMLATLTAVALLVTSMALGGCTIVESLVDTRTVRPDNTVKVPRVESPTVPTPAATPEAMVAVPPPTSTAVTRARVAQDEAESVVRAWFDALGSEEFETALQLTTGTAEEQTRALEDTIRREADQRGVEIDLVVQSLELSPVPEAMNGRSVLADFDVQANVITGPFSIPVREYQGNATFDVERVDGEVKIVEIRDVTGLPLP